MLPKCLKCSNKLPLIWFLVGAHWTKKKCVNCGTQHEFTHRRKVVGLLPIPAIILGMPLLESSISCYLVRLLLIGIIILPMVAIIPKQYQLSPKDKLKLT